MTTNSVEAKVLYEVIRNTAVLTISNPPLNAINGRIRDALVEHMERAEADDLVRAVVVLGENGNFSVGADINQFGLGVQPDIARAQQRMERSAKPVVAALEGYVLGGGLEIALGAAYRVATHAARLGLPEVNLGLLPGGGATQRVTRMIGPRAAIDLIVSGKQISAKRAHELGLVDALIEEEDLLDAAIRYALQKAKDGGPFPVAIDRTDMVAGADKSIFDEMRRKNARNWRGTVAPFKILECIEAACTQSGPDQLKFEQEAFRICQQAPAHAAQVHLFFAERKAAKIEGASQPAALRPIKTAAIIGAGTMGGGIAMSFANAGIPVKILDVSPDALARGIDKVRKNYATSVARGSLSEAEVDAAMALIEGVDDYDAISAADVVVEAVFEDMALKKKIFTTLDAVMKQGALLGSNTSMLDLDEIAAATRRPEDIVGLHFFSPANVMRLLEVVRGAKSAPEAIVTAMSLAKRIGKVAVLAGNCEGFIGNRIAKAYGREADFLIEEGATPWQVDSVLEEFGFPMGVFRMRDLAGLDVTWRIRQQTATRRDPSERDSKIADLIYEMGRLGQKNGAGYYRYEGRVASPDPSIEALVEKVATQSGIVRRPIENEEILDRILCAMVNEGARILDERIAQRASDIDVTYVYGYGFPKYRGGPMFWAEQEGLNRIHEKISRYHASHGKIWQPARSLAQAAAAGGWRGVDRMARAS